MQAECRIIPANAPLPVPRLSAYRPDHLLTALPLLLAGLGPMGVAARRRKQQEMAA